MQNTKKAITQGIIMPTFKGSHAELSGHLPKKGEKAHDFQLVNQKLEDVHLNNSSGKKRVLSIFPSLDTGVCLKSNKELNAIAKDHPHLVFYAISADLPFASSRICGIEHIHNLTTLSMMRSKQFGLDYGLLLKNTPLAGLLTRAVIVIDAHDKIEYIEVVDEITQEPDFVELKKHL